MEPLPYIFGGVSATRILCHPTDTLSQSANEQVTETVCCIFYVPVDVIKERLQIQSKGIQLEYTYSGTMDAFRQIASQEGARGIYKGYSATLLSYGPFSALYFLFYEKVSYFYIILILI